VHHRHQVPADTAKPLLLVDVDGVISLWGFAPHSRPLGTFASVDGAVHFLSVEAAGHLLDLMSDFFLVWCTGWEERANDHLPHILGLGPFPFLSFDRQVGAGTTTPGHWKLGAIQAYARDRPLAWIDDAFNDACHAWAREREAGGARTLLVETTPAQGLVEAHARRLRAFAAEQRARADR
jgi:hypothetical protein